MSSSIETIKGKKTLTEGENLNLSCQASGDPLPFVSWIIVGGGQHTYSNLVLTNIQRNQSGEYRCEATNPCNVDTKVVTVDVQCKYSIVSCLAGPCFTHLQSSGQFFNQCIMSFILLQSVINSLRPLAFK